MNAIIDRLAAIFDVLQFVVIGLIVLGVVLATVPQSLGAEYNLSLILQSILSTFGM